MSLCWIRVGFYSFLVATHLGLLNQDSKYLSASDDTCTAITDVPAGSRFGPYLALSSSLQQLLQRRCHPCIKPSSSLSQDERFLDLLVLHIFGALPIPFIIENSRRSISCDNSRFGLTRLHPRQLWTTCERLACTSQRIHCGPFIDLARRSIECSNW